MEFILNKKKNLNSQKYWLQISQQKKTKETD